MVTGAGSQGIPRHSPSERAPLRIEDYFTLEQVALGKKYEREKYLFFFADLLLTFGILALLTFTGLSSWLFSWADMIAGGRDWLARLLFLALVLVLLALVTFPLEIWEDYLHEHAYRLSDQSFQGWLWDQVKGWLVGFVLTLPLAYGLFFLIGRYPHGWWIPAGLAAFAFSVIFTYLSPVLIDPIFNTFKPVANQELKGRLVSLANHAGIRVKEVLEIDASRQTKKYNAYFAGLGPTKRIVIYDTFLRDGSIAEIESVLAHEIGHWQHGHLWKGILLSGVVSLGFFFLLARALEYASTSQLFPFYAPHDVAAFPFILLFAALLSFLSSPVASGISRHFERQADWTALILTRDTQTFLEVERKLALRNLSDIDPPPLIEWAFHSHPSTVHRMEMALEYAQQEKSLQ
ncbi:MAG: M48 family metallopeptidase [Candidatus Tectomicrobia bacterium]|uniref:M48 family metallopeptidase n=1 Tax=Tectimicrobiota bacterium TaxID=2528274 RepID=A0A932CRJ0_UNCTE|nr:M48 family metallopeptidase [Candidatus Tectomicrobia bacterium]